MLYYAGFLLVMVAIVPVTRGSDSITYMKEQVQDLDKSFKWAEMKELPNSKVVLDITSCKAKVEANQNYVFALIEYNSLVQREETERNERVSNGGSATTPNGCSCNEVLELFDFAYTKTPHLLASLGSIYKLVCGEGYVKNTEKQNELVKFLASDVVPSAMAVSLLDMSRELLRHYIVKISVTDTDWGLESIMKQLTEERKRASEKIASIITAVGLDKAEKTITEEYKLTNLRQIVDGRFFVKSNIISSMIKLGLKPDTMGKLLDDDLNVTTPVIKIVVLNAVFENAHGKNLLNQEQDRVLKIVNYLTNIITADSSNTVQPINEDLSAFVNSIFESAAIKKDWTSELTEQSMQAFCRVSLKTLSEKKPVDDEDGKTTVTEEQSSTPGHLNEFLKTFTAFDKTGLGAYKEANKSKMLDDLETPLVFQKAAGIREHFKFHLKCV